LPGGKGSDDGTAVRRRLAAYDDMQKVLDIYQPRYKNGKVRQRGKHKRVY
jgi:hypothetical protein